MRCELKTKDDMIQNLRERLVNLEEKVNSIQSLKIEEKPRGERELSGTQTIFN